MDEYDVIMELRDLLDGFDPDNLKDGYAEYARGACELGARLILSIGVSKFGETTDEIAAKLLVKAIKINFATAYRYLYREKRSMIFQSGGSTPKG